MILLSDKTFNSSVLNHPANEVWLVMLYGNESTEALHSYEIFRNASSRSGGIIKFARLDVVRAPQVVKQLQLRFLPAIRIFHDSGISAFKGEVNVENLLKAGLKFVHDVSENVTAQWKSEFAAKPAAILFTNSKTTTLWKGISSYFARKDVRIGVCRDKRLSGTFGVKDLSKPTIMFYNGTHEQVYKGEFKFRFVKQAMEQFFSKRLQSNQTVSFEMMTPNQFVTECIGGKQICILSATKVPMNGLYLLMKENSRRPMKFFAGVIDLPYSFMKRGGVWIYHPKRDAFIHVEKEDELIKIMDRVIDGSATSWIKRNQLINEL